MERTKRFISTVVFTAILSLAASSTVAAQPRHRDDGSFKIHRLHVLMNHGLIMFLDGINLKMISNMKMSPVFDQRTEDYALRNIEKGKRSIEMALKGDQMEILVEQGFGEHPLMKTALDLGETMLELIDVLEKMDMGEVTPDNMELHHMHILVNKGLENVAQGSNMIMATLLNSIPQIDTYLKNHGRNMVTNGRALIVEVSQGEEYTRVLESSADDLLIAQTRRCAVLSLKIADILSRMEVAKISE